MSDDHNDTKWYALAVIFCTPMGWVGLAIVGSMIALTAKAIFGH